MTADPPAGCPAFPAHTAPRPRRTGSGRRAAALTLLACGLAALAGCGGGGGDGTANPSLADPTTLMPAPTALRGVWRTLSQDGAYEMTIEPTLVHIAGPQRVQSGEISVEGDRIWFFRAPDGTCGGGWYRWTLEGSTLRLVNQSDGCGHRLTIMTWAAWNRVP